MEEKLTKQMDPTPTMLSNSDMDEVRSQVIENYLQNVGHISKEINAELKQMAIESENSIVR